MNKELTPMKLSLIFVIAFSIVLAACAPSAPSVPTGNKLRIVTENYPPYNFVDKQNNIVGQSTEIVQIIMQKAAQQANIEVMPLSDGLNLAQKGPNVIIFSLNRTLQRENMFKWVGPIGNYEQAFYTKKGSSIKLTKLEDARNAGKIGVYKGDAGNLFLTSQGFSNLDESQTDVEALKKLTENKVQLWLGNIDGLQITAKQAGINTDDLVLLPTIVIRADLYIAFSKDIPDRIISEWQNTLNALKQDQDNDGKTAWDKIHAKYSDTDFMNSLLK
jgi:polar amino acid transport system substrate-binding protein